MFVHRNQTASAESSCIIGFIIPFLLGGYWPIMGLGFAWVPAACRVAIMLCTGVLAILWWSAPVSKNERQWFRNLGTYLGLLVLSAVFATGVVRAMRNSLRICFLFAFCLILARAFRHPATRKAFGIGTLAVSLLLSVYVIVCYVAFVGLALPSYESTRIFKETLLERTGVSLNPLGFSSAFFAILAGCILRPKRLLMLTLVSIVAVSTVFTGSRAPLALMLISLIVIVLNEAVRRDAVVGWASLVCLSVVLSCAVYYFSTGVDTRKLAQITEGRTELWKVAVDKFLTRPFTGYGADSWADDLISRTPNLYPMSGELVNQHAGAYHNAYLTLLAEDGVVVCAFAIYLIWCGFRSVNQAFRRGQGQKWLRWMYTFAFLFLICRGLIEVPGLFGYGEDPAEFAAYSLVALIISLEATLASQRASTSVAPAVFHSRGILLLEFGS